jgi:hypothetical protein
MIDLAAARAVCEGATDGPWRADLDIFDSDRGIEACITNETVSMLVTIGVDRDYPSADTWNAEDQRKADEAWEAAKAGQELRDARFIASARTLLPRALDEISRLRALVEEACDIGRGLAAIGLDMVNGRAPSISTSEMIRSRAERLAAIRAQVDRRASERAPLEAV